VRIGVAAEPRELAGGFVISSATDGLAAYATTNPNLDFAVFFEPLSIQRVVLPDGTKQLVYAAGAVGASGPTPPPFTAVAMEFYNDRLGILSGPIASGMSGAALDYTVAATTDGLVTLQGTIDGDSASIAFGVNAIDAVLPTLDADGFPSDEFFYDSSLPYSLSSAQGTLSGVMRLRQLLPQ
jgi:hypothetical protein